MTIEKSTPIKLTETNKSIYGEESSSMKDFVVGVVVGGIIGAAAALLYAPKTGSELREDVAKNASQLKDKSAELSSIAKEKTVQFSSQLKDQSTQLVEKVKTKTTKSAPTEEGSLGDVVDAVEETLAEATEGIENAAEAQIEELLEPTNKQ